MQLTDRAGWPPAPERGPRPCSEDDLRRVLLTEDDRRRMLWKPPDQVQVAADQQRIKPDQRQDTAGGAATLASQRSRLSDEATSGAGRNSPRLEKNYF